METQLMEGSLNEEFELANDNGVFQMMDVDDVGNVSEETTPMQVDEKSEEMGNKSSEQDFGEEKQNKNDDKETSECENNENLDFDTADCVSSAEVSDSIVNCLNALATDLSVENTEDSTPSNVAEQAENYENTETTLKDTEITDAASNVVLISKEDENIDSTSLNLPEQAENCENSEITDTASNVVLISKETSENNDATLKETSEKIDATLKETSEITEIPEKDVALNEETTKEITNTDPDEENQVINVTPKETSEKTDSALKETFEKIDEVIEIPENDEGKEKQKREENTTDKKASKNEQKKEMDVISEMMLGHQEDEEGQDTILKLIPLSKEEQELKRSMCLAREMFIQKTRLHCMACNTHLGSALSNEQNRCIHPLLNILICRECFVFYTSGEFKTDSDGFEMYCRLCGQGGVVVCCTNCNYVFCTKCIGKGLGKNKIGEVQNSDDWKCFVCNPAQISIHRVRCSLLMDYIDLAKRDENVDFEKDFSSCCDKKRKLKDTEYAPPKKVKKMSNKSVMSSKEWINPVTVASSASIAGTSSSIVVENPIVRRNEAVTLTNNITSNFKQLQMAYQRSLNEMSDVNQCEDGSNADDLVCTPDILSFMSQEMVVEDTPIVPSLSNSPQQNVPQGPKPKIRVKQFANVRQMEKWRHPANANVNPPPLAPLPGTVVNPLNGVIQAPARPQITSKWFANTKLRISAIAESLLADMQEIGQEHARSRKVEDYAYIHNKVQEKISQAINSLALTRKELRQEFLQECTQGGVSNVSTMPIKINPHPNSSWSQASSNSNTTVNLNLNTNFQAAPIKIQMLPPKNRPAVSSTQISNRSRPQIQIKGIKHNLTKKLNQAQTNNALIVLDSDSDEEAKSNKNMFTNVLNQQKQQIQQQQQQQLKNNSYHHNYAMNSSYSTHRTKTTTTADGNSRNNSKQTTGQVIIIQEGTSRNAKCYTKDVTYNEFQRMKNVRVLVLPNFQSGTPLTNPYTNYTPFNFES